MNAASEGNSNKLTAPFDDQSIGVEVLGANEDNTSNLLQITQSTNSVVTADVRSTYTVCKSENVNVSLFPDLERSGGNEPRSSQQILIEKKNSESDLKTAQLAPNEEAEKVPIATIPHDAEWFYPKHQPALELQPYYHGYMNREDSEKIVSARGKGRFLVRRLNLVDKDFCYVITISKSSHTPQDVSKRDNKTSSMLAIKNISERITLKPEIVKNEVAHLRIKNTHERHWFWLTRFIFRNIQDLIEFHTKTGRPIDDEQKLYLGQHIKRSSWQLEHNQLEMGKFLGRGAFGEVYSGKFISGVFGKPKKCAIKTMQQAGSKSTDNAEFLHEANVMLSLKHKYMVQLYGVAALRDPIMIVMELASGGSLLTKLRQKSIKEKTLIRYSLEILYGMAYLENIEIIHRDLAARNILLDATDTVKISDFGLSVKGKEHHVRGKVKVPIRWLAPEVMEIGLFSSKSDVWAYGVTVWELFSSGLPPYGQINETLKVRIGVVSENLRLVPPEGCPTVCAELMKACFVSKFEDRPSFQQLKKCYNGREFRKLPQTETDRRSWWNLLSIGSGSHSDSGKKKRKIKTAVSETQDEKKDG